MFKGNLLFKSNSTEKDRILYYFLEKAKSCGDSRQTSPIDTLVSLVAWANTCTLTSTFSLVILWQYNQRMELLNVFSHEFHIYLVKTL